MKRIGIAGIIILCVSFAMFASAAAEEGVQKINLVVNVAGYTPNIPQSVGPELEVAAIIAEEYEKLNPGVTIEFYEAPSDGFGASALKTSLLGGTAPDITIVQITEFWTDTGKGWFEPLDEYFDKPNPYVEGNKKWMDLFYPDLSMRYRAPDDKLYTVAIDLVDTGVFYNKAIFKELGLEVPTNFAEFFDIQKKILENGKYVPFGFRGPLLCDWTTTIIQEALQKELMEQINTDGDNRVSLEEIARAYKQGLYMSGDPEMLEAFRIIKEWSQYWQEGWVTAKGEDVMRLYATQKIAMMWDGSWAMRGLKYDPAITFEWGIFSIPSITTATSPLAKGNTSPSVGGIANQMAVTNSAIRDGKVEAAIDFLMFWTAPQNAGRLINESMSFLPNIRGVVPSPEMDPFKDSLENWKNYWWDGRLGSEVYGKMTDEIWVPYLLDKASLEETIEKRDALLAENFDRLIEDQGWNF